MSVQERPGPNTLCYTNNTVLALWNLNTEIIINKAMEYQGEMLRQVFESSFDFKVIFETRVSFEICNELDSVHVT